MKTLKQKDTGYENARNQTKIAVRRLQYSLDSLCFTGIWNGYRGDDLNASWEFIVTVSLSPLNTITFIVARNKGALRRVC
uniref:Transposase n=1 Tax=Angiostrongylus cantonensis TaxID=6313 RepID=A0A0K0CVG2_ANGCA